MPGKPAVFLDRDNTLIRNDGDLGDPAKVELLQGAAMAVASICGLGFRTVVVTNQGGVARGKYGEADVDAVHDRLAEMIADKANGAHVDAFYFCPYHPKGSVPQYTREHEDRKPQPGMLLRAAKDHGLDLHRSWMVGDALRDVEAGKAAGCRTVWLCDAGDALQHAAEADAKQRPDYVAGNLVEAVRIIASQRHSRDEPKDAAMHAAQSGPPGKRFDAAAMARLQRMPAKPKPSATAEPLDANDDESERNGSTASATSVAPSPKTSRPFRPYALPPDSEEPASIAEPAVNVSAAKEAIGKLFDRVRSPSVANKPEPTAKPKAKPKSEPEVSDEPESTPSASSDSAPRETPDALPETADPELIKLARAILQELRGQRGAADAGPAVIFAVVLQSVAGIALLAGLWLGADSDGLFLRWLGVALIVQIAVIALLLGIRSGR
ncbi:MAG: HAD-IIIA family hydrolase [Planctomycetota bacterium]